MSHLFLVRHGQASFLEENYDKLSPKGEAQARMLGEYWARLKVSFDEVYSGPRVRQQDTARIAGEAYRGAGLPWPQLQMLPEFDEFQAELVIAKTLPGLRVSDEDIHRLYAHFESAQDRAEQFKRFQRIFEVIVGRWAAGELTVGGVEPWAGFVTRVGQGLDTLALNGNRGRRIAVFCSGGPIGVAMQRALNLSTADMLKTAWMMCNCG
ncbi:MAG: histidine phosphatase family protein, partial [Candidatus Angelobacter sp.]